MSKLAKLFSVGLFALALSFAYLPTTNVMAQDRIEGDELFGKDCGLKKKCLLKSGCKDVVGGCCIGPAAC